MTDRPSTELLLVQVLMRSMHEVLRTHSLPVGKVAPRVQSAKELRLAFSPIWHRLSALTLTVRSDSVEWDDQRVLGAEEDDHRLGDALWSAGLRSLTLVPGVEAGEALRFLGAVHRASGEAAGPPADLLTLLFEEDLEHLTYEVDPTTGSELPTIAIATTDPVGADVAPPNAAPERMREAVRADVGREDRTRGVVRLEKFDSTLYFLDQREIEYLRAAIDREYSKDHAMSVLGLLLDILQLRAEPAVRLEVIGVLEDFLPYLLGTGRFEAVAHLISEVREVARTAPDITADQKHSLDALRASVSQPQAIAQLFHALEEGGVQPTQESLGTLLRELRPKAISHVMSWLDSLSSLEAKMALGQAVDEFFREWPHALSRMVGSSDKGVVSAALEMAARLRLPEFVPIIGELTGHNDAGTRVQVARTLAAIGSGPALRSLVALADDPDSGVRTVVYRAVAERPYRGGARALEEAVASRDMEERGLRERRALFRAYGTVAGPGGITKLEPILRGKGPIGRRATPETRACAALALGIIGTPGALAMLREAADDRDPVVRTAASSALRREA